MTAEAGDDDALVEELADAIDVADNAWDIEDAVEEWPRDMARAVLPIIREHVRRELTQVYDAIIGVDQSRLTGQPRALAIIRQRIEAQP